MALPDADEGSRIGVIVSDRAPLGPLAEAVLAVARDVSGRTGEVWARA
jgi:hypothetical protein